jgi:outer membrane protein assembly factor BamA
VARLVVMQTTDVLKYREQKFIETFDPMEQVLSVVGRSGTLGRFDGEDADVPFFEKFFLGGHTTLGGGITVKRALNPRANLEGVILTAT